MTSCLHCLPVKAVRRVSSRPKVVAIEKERRGALELSGRLHIHAKKLSRGRTRVGRRGGADYPLALRSQGCLGRHAGWTHHHVYPPRSACSDEEPKGWAPTAKVLPDYSIVLEAVRGMVGGWRKRGSDNQRPVPGNPESFPMKNKKKNRPSDSQGFYR